MRIIIVGPGRAGGALAVAAFSAGHEIVGVYARRPDDQAVAGLLSLVVRPIGSPLPHADLMVIAVRDDAIAAVATQLAPLSGNIRSAVHLSGLTATSALMPLEEAGLEVGSLHPLQSLPDPETGAAALRGAHVGVTGPESLARTLFALAESLGATPFLIPDDTKPLYHAAAAASANYVIAALALGAELFRAAGVDPAVSRPLVEAVIANTFDLGAAASLTGPIARGDVGTVRDQVAAVAAEVPQRVDVFKAMGRVTATMAGTADILAEVLA